MDQRSASGIPVARRGAAGAALRSLALRYLALGLLAAGSLGLGSFLHGSFLHASVPLPPGFAAAQGQSPPSAPGVLSAPSYAAAPGLIVGGSYELAAGTTLRGDLNAVGAAVAIAQGATLDGRLVAIGGSTVLDGTVRGDVHAYGGSLTLGDHAVVEGDLTTDYAALERASGAVVNGILQEGTHGPVAFRLPTYVRSPVAAAARATVPRDPLDMLFRAIALGLLGMLVVALVPARVTRVRQAMMRRPVRMGFDGLLTGIVVSLLLVLLAVTLIGIPLTILGGILLYASVLFGWIAFGDAIGDYLADVFQQQWGRAVRVAVGAFALGLIVAALEYVPVLGGLAALVVSVMALGAVRSTRYGGREPGPRERGTPSAAAPRG